MFAKPSQDPHGNLLPVFQRYDVIFLSGFWPLWMFRKIGDGVTVAKGVPAAIKKIAGGGVARLGLSALTLSVAFNKHHIWSVFILVSILVGCGAEYSEQVNKFRLVKVHDKWTFKFPYNLKETQLKDYYYQRVFHSPNDSIVLKVANRTMTVEDATRQFDVIAGYEKRGEVSRMCMGSLEGIIPIIIL